MLEPDQALIDALVQHLCQLPDVQARQERHESWMTAEQIAAWWSKEQGVALRPEAIDEMLRCWWLEDPESRAIRPAKYPDRATVCRLWGHVQRVGSVHGREIQMFRLDRPVELEEVRLEQNAPLYFLSYAAPDLHFAARVRMALAARGVRSWMYAGEIQARELIVEGVHAALSMAERVIALITPLSLPSAWMDSEIHAALELNKPVVVAFDGSHIPLMELLESWHPPRHYDEANFDRDRLLTLRSEYTRYQSEERVQKYETSATSFLWAMGCLPLCVYPRRPAGWAGDPSIGDFEKQIPGPPDGG